MRDQTVTMGSPIDRVIDRVGVTVDPAIAGSLTLHGDDPVLPTPFAVGTAAAVAQGLAAATAAAVGTHRGLPEQTIAVRVVDAAAALIGFRLIEIDGVARDRDNATNPVVAMYPTSDDRWIHLHGGFPLLRAGTLRLLGLDPDRDHHADAIAAAVGRWTATDLEDALAAAGLCGTIVRTPVEWDAHPAGRAVGSLGVFRIRRIGDADPLPHDPLAAVERARPLHGVRVLDLTRVLAGPSCGRTLAAHGARVLRVDGPSRPDIELFVTETSHGKRLAELDLADDAGRARFDALAAGAHVVVQGYRPGALARRGLDPATLARRRPGIVVADISCYGPEGPFADRPGWEQLAQATSGLAALQGSPERPQLVPAAACDYTTGSIATWGVAEALRRQMTEGGSWHVEASLCQTAAWLRRIGPVHDAGAASGIDDAVAARIDTDSPWGHLRHLGPGVAMSATPARWDLPSSPRGSHPAAWW